VSGKLERAASAVSGHMGAIVDLFHPGAKITVIVRPTHFNDDGSRDFLMTDDDLAEVTALIDRRVSAQSKDRPS